MKIKKIYTCDCCGEEFKEPGYIEPEMSILNFSIIYDQDKFTIGKNGENHALCAKCTRKLKQALKDIGYKTVYKNFETYGI